MWWVRGYGLGFINHVVTGGAWDVCLGFDCGCVGGVGGGSGLGQSLGVCWLDGFVLYT